MQEILHRIKTLQQKYSITDLVFTINYRLIKKKKCTKLSKILGTIETI